MSERRHTIHLHASSAQTESACREALLRLGWEISGRADRCLIGDEEPWRLSCHTSPSRIEVRLHPETPARTDVSVTVSAPGFGPATCGRLERQIAAFEEKVVAAIARMPSATTTRHPSTYVD